MKNQDYKISIAVEATPQDAFNSINDIAKWWSDEWKGSSRNLHDEFSVHFEGFHDSTQRLVEVIPNKKVVWLVTDSALTFIKDQQEWTNTKISFELVARNGKTEINFTHFGLVPEVECYKDCTKGWDYYIKGSLYKFITEGKGTPGL